MSHISTLLSLEAVANIPGESGCSFMHFTLPEWAVRLID